MTEDEAWGQVDDLELLLKRREADCAQVREVLVPLLVDIYPYSEGIRGDTDKLRAGFVALTAAERIHAQEVEIERLLRLLGEAGKEVGRRADDYVSLMVAKEALEDKVTLLQADMVIRDETNQGWVEYKDGVEADHERLRIRLSEALGLGPDERGRPLHIEEAIEEIKRKVARVELLEKTTLVRKALMGRTAERASEMAAELNELRAKELRTPDEWSEALKIEVRDPDGWRFDRKGEHGWVAQDWEIPMTRAEFAHRAAASTVRPLEGSNWGRA